MKALEEAERAGVLISLDVGALPATEATDFVRSALRSVDLLFLNKFEAALLTGIKNPERAAKRALKLGPNMVAMKLGREGCLVLTEREEIRSPAFDVRVVDTTELVMLSMQASSSE